MPTNSSASSVASEIDAIIARAMAEYANAHNIDVFDSTYVDDTSQQSETVEESVIREEPVHEEIPTNSGSLLVSETTSRFSGAIWFDNIQQKAVMLAGLGGIGSYVAFLLSRLNVRRLDLYDDDTVEAGNLSGQLYSGQDIGHNKVDAIGAMIASYSNFYNYDCFNERFTAETSPEPIMMCGFDNMEARQTYFDAWKDMVNTCMPEDRKKCLFIDGRLAAESLQVFCITGDDTYNIERYEKEFLFDDSAADPTICSYKQTTFMANMIASLMVNLFVNFCANECDPLVPRDLPFFTEYTAETMFFKVVN